jgi:predicted TPR repeat methyltransferase
MEIEPENESGRHLLAALKGETTDRAPEGYVRNLFDDYAARFETDLVKGLGYEVPRQLRELLGRMVGPEVRFGRLADLGCGSGLVGEAFGDICDWMGGVDLAPRMIEQARAKDCYDELVAADVVDYVTSATEPFDLVVAADTVVYLGNLDPLFKAVAGNTSSRARLVVSTELSDDSDFVLRRSGRYAHSEEYLSSLAWRHGMSVEACENVNLRKEGQKWIQGQLLILRCG